MKTLAEAAMDLPWLAPSVASLLALARSQLRSVWTDPGMVLLSAQLFDSSAPPDVAILEAVLHQHEHYHLGFVDWSQPGPDAVHRVCHRQAILASLLAEKLGVDGRRAWTAGFLAPLGWLGLAAADPTAVAPSLKRLQQKMDASTWQRQAWGHG